VTGGQRVTTGGRSAPESRVCELREQLWTQVARLLCGERENSLGWGAIAEGALALIDEVDAFLAMRSGQGSSWARPTWMRV